MKFLLKRRLNPFLLLTTIVALSLLAGLSIIFQTQFEGADEVRTNLQSDMDELNAEIKALEQNNTQLTRRNQELENRTAELEERIIERGSQESSLESEIERLNNRTEQLQQERNNLREEKDDILSDLDVLCRVEPMDDETAKGLCDRWAEGWDSEN